MAIRAPLDTTIEIVTPENIAFEYQLAGPFRRLPAFLIDFFIRIVIFFGLVILAGVSGITFTGVFGFTPLPALLFAALFIAFFGLSWFYGAACETYLNGRTPGKWACGLRVISDDGHPISGIQALLRNLLREADLLPVATVAPLDPENPLTYIPVATGLIGLTSMLLSKRLQRLGDIAASTIVVIDQRNWSLPLTRVNDARVPALASFIPANYKVTATLAKALASYAERRAYLSMGRRREIAKHIALPLIDRFAFRPDIDPDLLLFSLYYRTFLASEQSQEVELGTLAAFSPLAKDMHMSVPASTTAPDQEPAASEFIGVQSLDQPSLIDETQRQETEASDARGDER